MSEYVKQVWEDGVSPVNAERLNHMEEGIANAGGSGGDGGCNVFFMDAYINYYDDYETEFNAEWCPFDKSIAEIMNHANEPNFLLLAQLYITRNNEIYKELTRPLFPELDAGKWKAYFPVDDNYEYVVFDLENNSISFE